MRSLLTVSFAVSAFALALSGCGGKQPAADETASEAAAVETAAPVATDTATTEATATPAEAETTPAATATPTATPAESPSPSPKAASVAVATPPASFGQCAICHSATKGAAAKVGPNLFGVYGTKAGEVAGYAFSPALKASGLVWNDANLDKWLANPMTMVPGTRMAFAGIGDAAERKALIAYLKAQK